MSTPNRNHANPADGAVSEIVSAMSALNMVPDPVPESELAKLREHKGDLIYLSESDKWAKHAMDHLFAAATNAGRAYTQRQNLLHYLRFLVSVPPESPDFARAKEQAQKYLNLVDPITTESL